MKLKILIVIFGLLLSTSCENSKSPTENNENPGNDIGFIFRITVQNYNETDNLEQAVQNEFGSNYEIADWNDVVNYCQNNSASQFISNLSTWQVGYSLFVTRDGAHFWAGTNRHYFITRHDHNLPGNYLSHGNIDNHYIDLGSWYGVSMKILAVQRSGSTTTGTITGKVTDASNGSSIPDVSITTQPSAGSATTNTSGYYTINGVPAGTYTVTASKNGYDSESSPVNVTAGGTTTANFSLSPASTGFPFKMTVQNYNETDNLEQAVQNEFGSNYEIADWNDVVNYCQNNSASQFISNLSTWQVGYSLFVTRDGTHFWAGTNRHYFITRHDHNLPGNYLSHANIENHYIDLGSWYNVSMKILAIHK